MEKQPEALSPEEFTRLANNFYFSKGIPADYERIALDSQLCNYIATGREITKKRYKIAFVWICLNAPYWQYAHDMIEGAKKFFLPGHDTDYFLWSDMPPESNYGATVFPTEAVDWPLPTLMRYSLFLQQEEKLKEYDYIFYCDVDMKFVGVVGDEILGEGLTAAQHPMYALDKKFWPPYEPNQESTAYINRPGKVVSENGQPRFMPLYYAGGFQGGKSDVFIKAMKVMKKSIDADFSKNYVAIWNDESHWNKYLTENPPDVVLTPSYIYPDSLIKEYYEPIWGCSYQPKLMTLTKKFSTSAEAAQATMAAIDHLKTLPK
jgi:hypothetical protein